MSIFAWLRAFVTGVPTTEMAERWRVEDTKSALLNTYGDERLEGDVNYDTRLRFEYVDRDGVCTEREIVNWIDTRFYVKGVCTARHATRTFRKDQIERWISGQDALRHGVLSFGQPRF